MSASERLRALGDEFAGAPWMYDAPDGSVKDLRGALPEIVAVIEAAENFDARFEERFVHGMAAPLNAALAALDAKLSA